MKKGRVTLEAAEDYGRRCVAIAKERRSTADVQDAMDHPDFKKEQHILLDRLAAEQRRRKPLMERSLAYIQVGTHDLDELRQAFLGIGRMSDWGADIFKKIKVATEPGEAELVAASNAELGYAKGCSVKQTFEAGVKLGWMLCSPEDAAQYLIQHGEELKEGEWMLFAMEPITDSYGNLLVFSVVRYEGFLWLSASFGHPGAYCSGSYRWVFRRK